MNRSNRGESFVETLISMFIIALGMVILSTAISLSARMNAQANSKSELVFANLEGLSRYTPDPSDPPDEARSVKVNGLPEYGCGFWRGEVEVKVYPDNNDINLYTIGSGGSNEMYFYVFP